MSAMKSEFECLGERGGQKVLFHKVLFYWVGHAFNVCMLCRNCKIPLIHACIAALQIPATKSEFECLGEKKRSSTFLVLLPPVPLKCPSLCVLTYIPLPFYCEFCLKQNTALLSHLSQLVREVIKKPVILRSGWP